MWSENIGLEIAGLFDSCQDALKEEAEAIEVAFWRMKKLRQASASKEYYARSPKRRAYMKALVKRWKLENPERAKEIARKSDRKRRANMTEEQKAKVKRQQYERNKALYAKRKAMGLTSSGKPFKRKRVDE